MGTEVVEDYNASHSKSKNLSVEVFECEPKSETLIYMAGKQDTAELKPVNAITGDGSKEVKNMKDPQAFSPLTRILHKEVAGYTIEELDKAVTDILSETDSANLTIPEFKDILMKKLEDEIWPDGIYISDEDE